MDIKILGVPTVREADGLALSSRNAYLNERQRQVAPALHEVLQLLANKAQKGRAPIYYITKEGRNTLLARGFDKVDYCEFRDAETLEEVTNAITKPTRLLAAVHLGNTRLIDNVEVVP
jgi:pantoate--beta-alanine ligase